MAPGNSAVTASDANVTGPLSATPGPPIETTTLARRGGSPPDVAGRLPGVVRHLPENLLVTSLGNKLQAIAELDLEPLQGIDPPRGHGRGPGNVTMFSGHP